MNFKVQIILILVFYKKVSSINNNLPRLNRLPKVPPNLSLYRYEGNFYPVYASKAINLNVGLQGVDSKPLRFTRYLNPVHLSHHIYHDAASNNNNNDYDVDDETGSEYQMAMKVQPLQKVISSGKPQDIEESGKSQTKRQLKIETIMMSPVNGFYQHKNSKSMVERVPNKTNTDVSRRYHDIFMKYKSPQELVFGHVLSWPELTQKRLEKRNNNHFKGQVIWADKTGGYGEHYWDLAQGAL